MVLNGRWSFQTGKHSVGAKPTSPLLSPTSPTHTLFPSLSHHPLQSTSEFAKILFISLKYRLAQVLFFLLLFSFFIPIACDADSWGTCSGWPWHQDAELWLGSSLLILNFKGFWSSEQTFSSPWPFLSQPHWSSSREETGSLSWQDSEGPTLSKLRSWHLVNSGDSGWAYSLS